MRCLNLYTSQHSPMDGALPLRPWVNAGGGEDDGTKEKQNPRRQDGCATGVLFFDCISFLLRKYLPMHQHYLCRAVQTVIKSFTDR